MRVALIGAGKNGHNHMLRLAEMDDVEVVGVADPVADNAGAVVAEVGGQTFSDHCSMLDKTRPDAVWVSSPCWLHPEHTIAAAQAGAHVMCEKPMGLKLEDCDRMIAAARESNVKLMVGQSTRYHAPLVEMKRILESGSCGRLVNAWSTRTGFYSRPDSPWRLDGDKSGGTVFELHIHEIDFVCTLGGHPTSVYARTSYCRDDAPSFLDSFSALLSFEGGAYATIEASWNCPLGRSGRGFVGSKGSAEAQGRDSVRVMTVDAEKPSVVEAAALPTLDEDFVRAIREDAPAPVPGEDGRANVEIGLAIVESGRTGQVVPLPLG